MHEEMTAAMQWNCLDGLSMEATARDIPNLAAMASRFAPGTIIAIPYLANESDADRLDAAAAALYLAAILWILGYDTIYAHQDREDDTLVGVKSTARLFGARTREMAAVCYSGTLLLLLLAMAAAGLHFWGYVLMLLPAGLLAWQVITLDIDDQARCLALFKLNREVGLAVALAMLVGRL